MRIAVIGAGGVGGYFGGRLAAAGVDVSFLARGAHLEAIRSDGLRIESSLGNVTVPARALADAAEIGLVDVVIVAVKLWDTEALLPTLKPLIGRDTVVLSLQNGVDKDRWLVEAFGEDHVVGALCYIGAVIERPGVIRQTGMLQKMVLGAFHDDQRSRVDAFADACRRARIDVAVSEDIERATWEKFVFLVGLSGATSVMRLPIGPIRSNPRARAFLAALFRETVAVGRARGVRFAEGFVQDRLAFCDTLDPAFTSSMHADVNRGYRLEMPWLQGAVSAMGSAAGIPTSANDFVGDVLSPYVEGPPLPVPA